MFLRNLTVLIILSIAFFAITYFFVSNNSPFNLEKIQEFAVEQEVDEEDFITLESLIHDLVEEGKITRYFSNNAFVGGVIFALAVSMLFGATHFFIDKLFFREFYDNASLFDAVRRGVFFGFGLIILLYLKLKGSELLEIIISAVVIIMIEVLFTKFLKAKILEMAASIKQQAAGKTL